MKKYKRGYAAGVFDLFHIGHLNLLKASKGYCDELVVAVSVDDLVKYKNKKPVIPFEERIKIVESIMYVDEVVPQVDMDKLKAAKTNNIDVMFVGSDGQGTEKWNKIECSLKENNIDVIYFPYTTGTSSTLINETLKSLKNKST